MKDKQGSKNEGKCILENDIKTLKCFQMVELIKGVFITASSWYLYPKVIFNLYLTLNEVVLFRIAGMGDVCVITSHIKTSLM